MAYYGCHAVRPRAGGRGFGCVRRPGPGRWRQLASPRAADGSGQDHTTRGCIVGRPDGNGIGSGILTTRLTLIERVRNLGNAGGWNEFHVLYQPLIEGCARKLGVPEHAVGDVRQEVFIKLLHALPAGGWVPARGRFRTWLYVVTCNASRDWFRSRGRCKEVVQGPVVPPEPASSSLDAAFRLEYRRRVLGFVLESIRPETSVRDWTVFEQCMLRRRPAADVAGELGLKIDNVYKIASRTFAKVRDLCLEYDEDLADAATDLPW